MARRTFPNGRRFSRRQILGGAGALAAGAFIPGCIGGSDAATPTASPARRERPDPTATRAPADPASYTSPEEPQPGGTLRYTGFVTSDQVYDPHKTQAAPFAGVQAAVFSRLIAYADQSTGELEADLARELPEQPDATTWIFRIHPDARWQDREPLNGRPVTAEDVRFSIERQRDGDASFPRKGHWVNVEDIETPNDSTVIVRTGEPLAPMLGYFAEPHAFIVAPELEEAGFSLDTQVGSGPFTLLEWNEGEFASLGRNHDYFRNDTGPWLDGLSMVEPVNSIDIEAYLRTRRLDLAFLSRPQADRLRESIPNLFENTVGDARFWSMRFQQTVTPYDDVRVRKALSFAIDRRQMLDQFFAGSGEMNPWISWPLSRWSLPPDELQQFSGYRGGSDGRDRDIAEAKALIEAYESDGGEIPEELGLVVLDMAENVLGLGSFIREQLAATLGINVVIYPVDLERLINGMLDREFPWVAGPDDGWLDLDDWVYPYFHSRGTKNTFAVRNDGLDGLIEQQRTEMDEDARREIGYEIQRQLLSLALGINFVSERVVALGWSYVQDFPFDLMDGYQHQFARTWIDTGNPWYTRD